MDILSSSVLTKFKLSGNIKSLKWFAKNLIDQRKFTLRPKPSSEYWIYDIKLNIFRKQDWQGYR